MSCQTNVPQQPDGAARTAGLPGKTCWRLIPCPGYDVESLESWLAAMAAKGLVLCKDGIFAGFACFERQAPCALRYRLDAAPEHVSLWSDNGGQPDEEAQALAAAAGWDYLATRGQFFVYCTADPDAPELNTDPRVQALAIRKVKKRLAGNLLSDLILLVLYGLRVFGSPVLTLLELGTWFGLAGLACLLWLYGHSLASVCHLRRLQKQLADGRPLDHQKDWHPARRRLFMRAGAWAAAVLWCVLLFSGWQEARLNRNRTPLAGYSGTLPFATLAQLRPDQSPAGWQADPLAGMLDDANQVNWYSDLLAAQVMEYSELARVSWADGQQLSAHLEVQYYELRSPALAAFLVQDIVRYDRRTGYKVQPLVLEGIEADDCVAYTDVFPTVVLRQGCRVARYQLVQFSESDTLPLEQWAAAAAAALKQ